MEITVGVVGIALYGCLGIFMILSFMFTTLCTSAPSIGSLATNVRYVFRFMILSFLSLRVVWLSLHTFADDTVVTFILNRFAIITFLTTFTLIIFYWAERFHKNYYDTKSFLPQLGWVFVVMNVLVYSFQITIIALFLASDESHEGNPIYEANIITDVVLSTLVSIGFFVYGWLLFFVTKNAQDGDVERRDKELLQILCITVLFTACFMVRVFMFLYRPLTGEIFSEPVFYTLGYFVPELIPSLLQIFLSERSQGKHERDTKFIDALYQESQESIENFRGTNVDPDDKPLLQTESK